MIVSVDATTAPMGLELLEPDDFKAFKIVVAGTPPDLGEALAPLGRLSDPGHAHLRPEAVAALPGARPDDPAWRSGYDAMLAYAATKGWTDDQGAVQAHIETTAG